VVVALKQCLLALVFVAIAALLEALSLEAWEEGRSFVLKLMLSLEMKCQRVLAAC
jgi:hypothetical protein